MTGHAYLILPLFSSGVYAAGTLFIKRSLEMGQPPRRVLVGSNLAMWLCFLPLLLGAKIPSANLPVWMWLAPPVCSVLFFLGQVGTFRALAGGDVSVATPVLGSKVVLTALGCACFLPGRVPAKFWIGSALCSLGVALLSWSGGGRKKGAWRAVGWGLLAAASFSLTDVLVAKAAPQIGLALFGPMMMSGLAVLSAWVLPVWAWGGLARGSGKGWLVTGVVLIGMQAVGVLAGIVLSGDPVGVNIVYALRGLWSVGLVFFLGRWVGNREAGLPGRILGVRALGAGLLFGAVWAVLA
ncbi:MAG: DMT family transporter [Verrucomicrobia bacterium]|nr:DMT family transporter [Verrucomicrobiota bacterium]